MNIRQSILVRLRIAFLVMIVAAFTILYRIFDIQILQGEKWEKEAAENGLRFMKVKATRGNIYSDNGSLLATSLPFYRVGIDPTVASQELFDSQIDTLSYLLARFYGEKSATEYARELRDARMQGKRYKLLSRKLITYKDKKRLQEWPIFCEGRIAGGVVFEKSEQRFKPFEGIARRTIGFVSEEDTTNQLIGRGLEYSFNKELAGISGEALFQKIAGGHWKPINGASNVRPENGMDIYTTLDIEVQDYAHEILKAALHKHNANYGCIVFMDVKTGEIKTMVNLGLSEGEYVEDYNYAIGGQGSTEPGSTFKLASIMAVLEENKDITLTDSINTGDGKYLFYEECVMTDATKGGYGIISVRDVFERSSNIGISKLVFKTFMNKPEKYITYLDKFGFDKALPFQMEGIGAPRLNRPNTPEWSGCSLPWMSIGYESKVSPLQMLTFYNAVANDGKMIAPLIVKKVMKGNETVKTFSSEVLNSQIASGKTINTVKALLQGVVENGTAKSIKNDMFTIAGKTGTTQKLKSGRYTQSYYTSFCGYFPAENPRFSGIVVIDEPKTGEQYGGLVAAPVFKQVAQKLYIKNIQHPLVYVQREHQDAPKVSSGFSEDLEFILNKFNLDYQTKHTGNWVKTKVKKDTITWIDPTGGNRSGFVPDVRGMTLRDAIYLLENQGLEVRIYGKGRVQKQSIPPGRAIKKGSQIFLSLE
jgi:cell division protein FtsI (penicillin-binding protein 3)